MAQNQIIEDLIRGITCDILEDRVTLHTRGIPIDNRPYVDDIVHKIVMVIQEHFIERGLEKIYPYSIELVTMEDNLMNLSEKAIRVSLKGDSIEWAMIPKIVESDFKAKLYKISKAIFNQYRYDDNIQLVVKAGYKTSGMGIIKTKPAYPIDLMDSAFIMQIPYHEPELY